MIRRTLIGLAGIAALFLLVINSYAGCGSSCEQTDKLIIPEGSPAINDLRNYAKLPEGYLKSYNTDVSYGSSGETMDIYEPSYIHPNCTVPVFVFVHGGGWSEKHSNLKKKTDFNNFVVNLTRYGIAVARINYTLIEEATALYPAGKDAKTPFKDIDDAIKYLKRQKHVLSDTYKYGPIYIGGISAGGHLALSYSLKYGTDTSLNTTYGSAISKVIAIAAPTDLTETDFPTNAGGVDVQALINDYTKGQNKSELSPAKDIPPSNKKFLLIYNRSDNYVPYIKQGANFASALSQKNIAHKLITHSASPNGHSFATGTGAADIMCRESVFEQMLDFLLDRHIMASRSNSDVFFYCNKRIHQFPSQAPNLYSGCGFSTNQYTFPETQYLQSIQKKPLLLKGGTTPQIYALENSVPVLKQWIPSADVYSSCGFRQWDEYLTCNQAVVDQIQRGPDYYCY